MKQLIYFSLLVLMFVVCGPAEATDVLNVGLSPPGTEQAAAFALDTSVLCALCARSSPVINVIEAGAFEKGTCIAPVVASSGFAKPEAVTLAGRTYLPDILG